MSSDPQSQTAIQEAMAEAGVKTQRELADLIRPAGLKGGSYLSQIVSAGMRPGVAYRREIARVLGKQEQELWQ